MWGKTQLTPYAQGQPKTFGHATEGSDAELKFEMKWCRVPHWESQPKYTDELIDQTLVEHESQGMPL